MKPTKVNDLGLVSTKVVVISMPGAIERRSEFLRHAAKTDLQWCFFDALEEPIPPLKHDINLTRIHTGRSLRKGEVGCYSSHFQVWNEFVASGEEQLIVLEDDVLADWSALARLARERLSHYNINILRLFATHPVHGRIERFKLLSDHTHLMRVAGTCYGTQAYLLSREAAKALVNSCSGLTMPIDWAMSRYWAYGIANHAMIPFPVVERLVASTIGHDNAEGVVHHNSLVHRILRLGWRLLERSRRMYVDISRFDPFVRSVRDTGPAMLP